MSEKTLFLFPGAHKTGTTLLQSSLEINRSSLEKEGISVARRQTFYNSGLHAALKKADGLSAFSKEQLEDRLSSIFNGAPKSKILISLENIAGEVSPTPYRSLPKVIENLRLLFPEHVIQVYFYVRRQDTFIESAFVQEYHIGLRPDPEQFVKRFLDRPLDWMWPISSMSKTLTPQQVKVVPYEKIKNGVGRYLSTFYKFFSEQNPDAFVANYRKQKPFTNVSISRKGIEILDSACNVVHDREGRKSLANLLQSRFGTDRYPRYKFSDDQLERLAGMHRKINERLVKRGKFSRDMAAYYLFSTKAPTAEAKAKAKAKEVRVSAP